MTVAERMREITRGSVEEQRAKVINNHHKYANRLIETKIRSKALRGWGKADIKVGKKYSPSLVIEQLENKGFEVSRHSKNGRTILNIKW